jgi:hypothetical protein
VCVIGGPGTANYNNGNRHHVSDTTKIRGLEGLERNTRAAFPKNLRRVTGCLRNRAASRNRESVGGAFEVRRCELRGSELANDGGVVYRPDRRVETRKLARARR